MNLLPKTEDKFASKEYWDTFFKKRGASAFEWYGEYTELSKHLHKYIKISERILVLGCGNSSLSSDLFDVGYRNIISIDISEIVIHQMKKLHSLIRPSLKFIHMDALNMTFEEGEFSVAIDKGTLDALIPKESADVIEKATKYFKQIDKAIKFGGRYICISLLQSHVLRTILDYFPSKSWMLRIIRCFEAEKKAAESGQKVFPVFIVICTKFKNLNQEILELNVTTNESIVRLKNTEEVAGIILNIQQSEFISYEVKNLNKKEYKEISLDLFQLGEVNPRFKIYIINLPYEKKRGLYAAFVVPQGREIEWMFSTKAGRMHLTKIITGELEQTVQCFAPEGISGKILFLSIGSDVGKRIIRDEGESKISGKYVIEDVEINNQMFRRLVFLKNQNIIQSEAKLTDKKIKGNCKEVDHYYLASKYHIFLTIGCDLVCNAITVPSVAVIGLGGGTLCVFLRKYLSNSVVTGVDLDAEVLNLAQKWFGLELHSNLKVVVEDGIKFIHDSVNSGAKYNCLILDVDSKDTSMGISCPPPQFLEDHIVEKTAKCLKNGGVFLLNLLIRDKNLRPDVFTTLKKYFKVVISYNLEEDLNEVIFCFNENKNVKKLKASLKVCCGRINSFLSKNKQESEVLDIDEFLQKIQIDS
ncbi:methyltransferase-like protein 13 isoform X2 [Agrilus planipennis]|uniref:Methyltransferase-like protein 13 isoform X2 n=1 Tax=Agrilus planipennis TaxID=224129 RepID=A0A7F5QVY0_AGRPL|nr:methyltransferase-like protein 13 isoform X2 [Agrilus planipennis]